MENNNKQMPKASSKKIPLKFVVEGKEYQTCNQYITGAELKQIVGQKTDIIKASKEILEKFAKTAKLMKSDSFNFFRGINDDETMIDLDNIRYIFD